METRSTYHSSVFAKFVLLAFMLVFTANNILAMNYTITDKDLYEQIDHEETEEEKESKEKSEVDADEYISIQLNEKLFKINLFAKHIFGSSIWDSMYQDTPTPPPDGICTV